MLSWSLNLFRIRGIRLAVHSSFFLLLAWRGYQGWVNAGPLGLSFGVATTVLFFACVILHELGHSFTGMHFGVRVSRILLLPIGGMAEFDAIPRNPTQELLITLAGPAVNFTIAGLLWLVSLIHPAWFEDSDSFSAIPGVLLVANILMGIFNLLPIFPMDGGRILRACLAYKLTYVRATFWAATVGKVFAGLAAAYALFMALWEGQSDYFVTALLFLFIFSVNTREYQAVKRAEAEAAYWREVAERIRLQSDADKEPPILLG